MSLIATNILSAPGPCLLRLLHLFGHGLRAGATFYITARQAVAHVEQAQRVLAEIRAVCAQIFQAKVGEGPALL